MTTKDAVSHGKSVVGGGKTSTFGEEFPEAPAWAVHLHEQVAENAEQLGQVEQQKERTRERWQQALASSVEENNKAIAEIATAAGVASEKERRVAKGVGPDGKGGGAELSARAQFFTPQSEYDYVQSRSKNDE